MSDDFWANDPVATTPTPPAASGNGADDPAETSGWWASDPVAAQATDPHAEAFKSGALVPVNPQAPSGQAWGTIKSVSNQLTGDFKGGADKLGANLLAAGVGVGVVSPDTYAQQFASQAAELKANPPDPAQQAELKSIGDSARQAKADIGAGNYGNAYDHINAGLTTFIQHPYDTIIRPSVASLPSLIPYAIGGQAGAAAGGAAAALPAGAALASVAAAPAAPFIEGAGVIGGTGAGIAAANAPVNYGEYFNQQVSQELAARKLDPTDPQNVKQVLDDPQFMDQAQKAAKTYGMTASAIDGLTGMLGGRFGKSILGQTADVVTQTAGLAAAPVAGKAAATGKPFDTGEFVENAAAGLGPMATMHAGMHGGAADATPAGAESVPDLNLGTSESPASAGPELPPLPPPGIRETAKANVPPPTQGDIDSPIPTDLIQEGKTVLADNDAAAKANGILASAGLPNVDSPVHVDFGDGQLHPGTVTDAFTHDNPITGDSLPGIHVQLDDGRKLAETAQTLQNLGVKIIPRDLEAEAAAQPSGDQLALPPPSTFGRNYGEGFAMRDPTAADVDPEAPQTLALPKPSTTYGDGIRMGGDLGLHSDMDTAGPYRAPAIDVTPPREPAAAPLALPNPASEGRNYGEGLVATTPAPLQSFARKDGTPFSTEKSAMLAAQSRGDLKPFDLEAVATKGGFILREKAPEQAQGAQFRPADGLGAQQVAEPQKVAADGAKTEVPDNNGASPPPTPVTKQEALKAKMVAKRNSAAADEPVAEPQKSATLTAPTVPATEQAVRTAGDTGAAPHAVADDVKADTPQQAALRAKLADGRNALELAKPLDHDEPTPPATPTVLPAATPPKSRKEAKANALTSFDAAIAKAREQLTDPSSPASAWRRQVDAWKEKAVAAAPQGNQQRLKGFLAGTNGHQDGSSSRDFLIGHQDGGKWAAANPRPAAPPEARIGLDVIAKSGQKAHYDLLPDPDAIERVRRNIEKLPQASFQRSGGKSPDAVGEAEIAKGLMVTPAEPFSAHEQKIVDAVNEIARRIMPAARVGAYATMRATEETGQAGKVFGAHWRTREGEGIAHVVAWSLEKSDEGFDGRHTVRHEAIHYLRSVQLLDDQEYGRLRQLAEREGWSERYNIAARYPELDRSQQLDEAIAERFAGWRQGSGEKVPPLIRPLFNRIRTFLDKVASAVRRILGKKATADDIFSSIERGEVGGRGQPATKSAGGRVDHIRDFLSDESGSGPGIEQIAKAARDTAEQAKAAAVKLDTAIEAGRLGDQYRTAKAQIQAGKDFMGAVVDDVQMFAAPMAVGTASDRARAVAKDFANSIRKAYWQAGQYDTRLRAQFSPEARRAMWETLDQASVVAQEAALPTESGGKGMTRYEAMQEGRKVLDSLPPKQRAVVDELTQYADGLWQKAVDAQMVSGEGLPLWTPRMAVMIGEDGHFAPLKGQEKDGQGAPTLDQIGRNLTSTSSNLKNRKYLTADETEAAMRKVDPTAELVRDIRAMPLAMGRLERAIAGKELINSIQKIGKAVGMEVTSSGEKPGFFTLDHPAMKTYAPRMQEVPVSADELVGKGYDVSDGVVWGPSKGGMKPLSSFTVAKDGSVTQWRGAKDTDGNPIFDRTPIYIAKEFEGPLRAVLTSKPIRFYAGLMGIKGKAMGMIMYSPMIHNLVEFGRALPKMLPGMGSSLRVYSDGAQALADPAAMRELLDGGLAPIGGRGFMNDISSMMEEPNLKPGRSLTAKVVGGAVGLVDKGAGNAVKSGFDAAGDFWHNTLLWNQVAKLQAGLAVNMRDHYIAKGLPRGAAVKVAAHEANRYAGSLPAEAMGEMARRLANVMMFSRTFTIGNLGVLKDAIKGLPKDVRAQIERDFGPDVAKSATNKARVAAIKTVALDIALMMAGNALLQVAANAMMGQSADEQSKAMARRVHHLAFARHGLVGILGSILWDNALSPTADNEPGKENRIKVGHEVDRTAIYVRSPLGKVGEEFHNWTTSPAQTLKSKPSTIARPAMEAWSNDKGFGPGHAQVPVYNPNDNDLKIAGAVAWHFMQAQEPVDALGAAWHAGTALAHGEAPKTMDIAKTLGPVAGMTFSHGAPGGEAAGEYYAAMDRADMAMALAMPEIKDKLKSGDTDGAIDQMIGLGMDKAEIKAHLQGALAPGLTAGKMRAFDRWATPEEQDRMDRAMGR